ncbi:hypothetical protein KAR91_65850 [Candidatus Pacearchaeota archaeon]|nr:hypothetical protein [Candidatus Pacearchaeota archaeon]
MSKFVICTAGEWAAEISQGSYDGYYTTVGAYESARDGVDVTDEDSELHIYNEHTETGSIDYNGWTDKDATHFIIVTRSIDGSKHDGTVDGSGDTLKSSTSSGYPFICRVNNWKFFDLRMIHEGTDTSQVVYNYGVGGKWYLYNNVLKRTDDSIGGVVFSDPSSSHENIIYNNFVIAEDIDTQYLINVNDAENDDNLIINNSLYTPTGRGIRVSNSNTNKLYNNLNFAASVWYNPDDANADYEGVPCSEDDPWDPDGANCVFDLTAANIFNDLTADQEDLTLDSGGSDFSKIDNGGIGPASDSDVPTTDMLDNFRSGTTCAIGAVEPIVVGGQLLQHPGMDGLGSYQFNSEMNGGFNA